MILTLEELRVSYGARRVLDGVSFQALPGELTAVIGPNGAGKSTLMRAALGLAPYGGRIRLGPDDLAALDRRTLARRVSYLPQDSASRSALSVLEVVLLGRLETLGWHLPAREIEAAFGALDALGLADLAHRGIGELSGGQRQMVFIAQALARGPALLLLDEPTSALDVRHQLEILETVRGIAAERALTVLVSIHDLNLAARFADRMVILHEGQVHDAGPPHAVLSEAMLARVFGIEAHVVDPPGAHKTLVPLRALPSAG